MAEPRLPSRQLSVKETLSQQVSDMTTVEDQIRALVLGHDLAGLRTHIEELAHHDPLAAIRRIQLFTYFCGLEPDPVIPVLLRAAHSLGKDMPGSDEVTVVRARLRIALGRAETTLGNNYDASIREQERGSHALDTVSEPPPDIPALQTATRLNIIFNKVKMGKREGMYEATLDILHSLDTKYITGPVYISTLCTILIILSELGKYDEVIEMAETLHGAQGALRLYIQDACSEPGEHVTIAEKYVLEAVLQAYLARGEKDKAAFVVQRMRSLAAHSSTSAVHDTQKAEHDSRLMNILGRYHLHLASSPPHGDTAIVRTHGAIAEHQLGASLRSARGHEALELHTGSCRISRLLASLRHSPGAIDTASAKRELIDSLGIVSAHLHYSIRHLLYDQESPPMLTDARSVIGLLYPAERPLGSVHRFLGDYERRRALAMRDMEKLPPPETYEGMAQMLRQFFDIKALLVFDGERQIFGTEEVKERKLHSLEGLQGSLVQYAESKGWEERGYRDILSKIKEEGRIISLRDLCLEQGMPDQPSQVVTNAIVTYQGEHLLVALRGSHKRIAYSEAQQIGLAGILRGDTKMETKFVVYSPDDPGSSLLDDEARSIYVATIGRDTVNTEGAVAGLLAETPLELEDEPLPYCLITMRFKKYAGKKPGETVEEIFFGKSLERLLRRHKVKGITGKALKREACGEVGSMGLARIVRVKPEPERIALVRKAFVGMLHYAESQGCSHLVVVASADARAVYDLAGMPYDILERVDKPEFLSRMNKLTQKSTAEIEEEWEKYNHPAAVIIDLAKVSKALVSQTPVSS